MFNLLMYVVLLKLIVSPLGAEDGGVQSVFFYVPDILIFAISIFLLVGRKSSLLGIKIFGLICIALFFVFLSSLINDKSMLLSYQAVMKTLLPFVFLLAFFLVVDKGNVQVVYECTKRLSFCILLLTFLGFLILPAGGNRGEVWWPAYFSGLHTSTYTLFAGVVGAYACFIYSGSLGSRRYLQLYILFSLLMFAYGWGVRTMLLSAVLFFVSIYLARGKVDPMLTLFGVFSAGISLLVMLIKFDVVSLGEFDFYTSGRVSMYAEKIRFIADYNIYDWVFGRGVGSDLMITDVWWWAAKGSHNDVLTLFVENGVVFVVSLFAVIYLFYSRFCFSSEQKSIIVVVIFSSLVSNGYLTRPMPFYCLVFPLVLLAYSVMPSKRSLSSAVRQGD